MILYVFTIGFLMSVCIYLLLQGNLLKMLLGIVVFSATINMILMLCGRTNYHTPAFIVPLVSDYANPLPQACVLTAIVISFGLLAYLCALLKTILPRREQ